MSDAPAQQGAADDIVKNLKSEMDRKIGNIKDELKKSNDALLQQLASINNNLQPKPKKQDPTDIESEMWSDPVAFKNRIVNEADQRANEKLTAYLQDQQMRTQQLSELYAHYPELQQQGHPLAARAMEVFNSLSQEEQAMKSSFKLAVSTAASEMGVKPVSKRTEEEMDDFTLKATGKTRSHRQQKATKPETELFAQAMGLNTADETVKKKLEEYSKMGPSDWLKWK